MHEINRLKSLGLFIGTGECNANCKDCAGKVHRKFASKQDGIVDYNLIWKTLTECYAKGARSLSLTSSGEPTLSPHAVSGVLELVNQCAGKGMKFSPVNLYSNGIRIGEDEEFCEHFLPYWKSLGLNRIYVTVHDVDEKRNAELYGIESYPLLGNIISKIHKNGLRMRANLVLRKGAIFTLEDFVRNVEDLMGLGVDSISAWPIRGMNDEVDLEKSPSKIELDKIEKWIQGYDKYVGKVKLDVDGNRKQYYSGSKLTLFPDGTLTNKWCN